MINKIKVILAREKGSLVRSAVNMMYVGAGVGVMKLSSLVLSMVVARYSDAATFGAFTLFITVFLLSSEIPNTFDGSYIRFANNPDRIASPDVYWIAALISKIFLLILVVTFALVSINSSFENKFEYMELVNYAIISGVLFCIYSTYIAFFRQKKQFRNFSIFRPVPSILVLAGLGVLLISDSDITIETMQWLYMVVGFIVAALGVFIILTRANFHYHDVAKNYPGYMRVALILLVTSIIMNVSARFDVFVLADKLSLEELADYGVGLRVALIASLLSAVMSIILFPMAPEAQSNRAKFNRYIGLALIYSLLQTALAITLIIFIEPVIILLFGESYSNEISKNVSILLIISTLTLSYAIPFQALIQFGKYPQRIMYISFVKAVLMVSALLYASSIYGVIGAAYAVSIVSIIFFLAVLFLSIKTCMPKYPENV